MKITSKDLTDVTLIGAILVFLILLGISTAHGQDRVLPIAPAPQVHSSDGWGFHRGEDVLYGLTISTLGGMATNRPWVGLVAGSAAGVANEARYGKNFNITHLAFIEAGTLAGWEISRLSKRYSQRHHRRERPWIGN